MNGVTLWWGPVWDARESILSGTAMTILLSVVAIPLATFMGIAIAIGGHIGGKKSSLIVTFYVEAMRNSPSLVKLYFIFYGLPAFGVYPSPFLSGIAALALHNSAYIAEIFRGSLNAVPAAQIEAARGLGMSTASIVRDILLPQAFRRALPAMSNDWTEIIKDTALTSAISVRELFFSVTSMISLTMLSFEFLILTGIIYFIITAILASITRAYELRQKYPL